MTSLSDRTVVASVAAGMMVHSSIAAAYKQEHWDLIDSIRAG